MKKIYTFFLEAILILLSANALHAQVHVKGYYRSNGTYVEPHERTSPNSTVTDNYSYPGNYNPNKDGETTMSSGPYNASSRTEANSQSAFSISDLYIVNKSGDVKSANEFLSTYKDFLFSAPIETDSKGFKTVKWRRDRETIEITYGTTLLEGKATSVFFVKYLVPFDKFSEFESSLQSLNYKAQSKSITNAGEPFTLWGPENVLEMKLFCTMQKKDFYEVTIVM